MWWCVGIGALMSMVLQWVLDALFGPGVVSVTMALLFGFFTMLFVAYVIDQRKGRNDATRQD